MNLPGTQTPQSTSEQLHTFSVHPGRTKRAAGRWFLLALVLLSTMLYMAWELKRGWVPSDEGTLAESAERVLHGELPHRDFHEGYTGGLSYLNAFAFRLFGTNLASMRYMLFLLFLTWVPAFYYAASRFVSGPVASAVTLLAVAWGPANYGAAMPSWYNLFFATFGTAAILRYIEVQRTRWLFVAGFCAGVSVLFKLPGLFFANGVLLFLVFREQIAPPSEPAIRSRALGYRTFVIACIAAYELLLFSVLRKLANFVTYAYFWIPELAVGAFIIWHEFHSARDPGGRFRFLLREVLLFGAGFAVSIAILLAPYLLTGNAAGMVRDVLVVSGRLLRQASMKPPEVWFVEGCVANLALIGVLLLTRSKSTPSFADLLVLGVPLGLFIPVVLVLARYSKYFYQLVWSTIWVLAPVVVLVGILVLVRGSMQERLTSAQRQQLMLTLSVLSACSLIQFPFSNTIYFCYAAPLVFLAGTAVVSMMSRPPRLAAGAMICFCFFYAVFELTPGFVYHLGVEYTTDMQTTTLSLPRGGGLRVTPESAREYEELVGLIHQHARGEYILAKPDSPEVYFLSGFRDPSGAFFDFYEDPPGRTERALKAIHSHGINLVVLNHRPPFAGPIPADFQAAVEQEFPNRADAGDFEVRWKN